MYVYTKKKPKVLAVGKQIANVTINCKRKSKQSKKKITQERQSKGLESHLFVKLSALKCPYSVYVQPE